MTVNAAQIHAPRPKRGSGQAGLRSSPHRRCVPQTLRQRRRAFLGHQLHRGTCSSGARQCQPEHAVELLFARRHEDDQASPCARNADTDQAVERGPMSSTTRSGLAPSLPAVKPSCAGGGHAAQREAIPSRIVSSSSTTTIRRVSTHPVHPGRAGPARGFAIARAARLPRAFLSPQFAFERRGGHPPDTRRVLNSFNKGWMAHSAIGRLASCRWCSS